MNVIKRDGTVQNYDFLKILSAVTKAFNSVNQNVPEKFMEQVKESVERLIIKNNGAGTPIEDIQDVIQKELIKRNKYEVVEAFITYRKKREEVRQEKSDLFKKIEEKLAGKNIQNQNANLDEASFGGRIGEMASLVLKELALKHMRKQSRLNHERNEIYIHDLDAWMDGRHNCLTIPFDDLLANGFKTRQTDVRPAGSVNTALQLVAVIFQLQSLQQFGGVSASHLDWSMVPYVRLSFGKHFKDGLNYIENITSTDDIFNGKDIKELSIDDDLYKKFTKVYEYAYNMTKKEIHQAVEGLYHNLNTLQSRSGNQLPFTSINYGTCTLEEGRMVTEALLKVAIEGLGKFGITSIFPCGIFQYMKGVNDKEGTPNYDLYKLALKSTSQRLYPNYANIDWSGNAGYDRNDPKTYFSTMGCRTANGIDINAEEGVNPQTKDGRGNICPVTIIMPTLAVLAQQKVAKKAKKEERKYTNDEVFEEFLKLLDKKIHEAKDTLIERFNYIASQSPESGKFMYENHTMLGYKPEEGIISALKHGTIVIGQIGLAETLTIIFGVDHTNANGMIYAKEIEGLFKKRCAEFKQEYKLNFGVYYTPAENLCYTAMTNFKKRFKDYEKENVTYFLKQDENGNLIKEEKIYFTNSMHVPVWHKLTPFEKIDIESQLTGYSNAGCITYVELPSSTKHNLEALETIVNYAMDKDIPYFAINVPNDACQDCGFTDEINTECPKCGSTNIKRLRRVTGYLTGDYTSAFNMGKIAETDDRVKHNKEIN